MNALSGTDAGPALADLPLAELAIALAPLVAEAAAFDGWSAAAVTSAAARAGVPAELAMLAYERGGPDADLATRPNPAMAMIAAWVAHGDAAMACALPADALAKLPIRVRIASLVRFRLTALAGREEALRRAFGVMLLPTNAAWAARLGWQSADVMWRLAGDIATDYNHYSKRAILAALTSATLLVFIDDASDGKAETLAFLDHRIEGVMRFEKAKARLLGTRGGALAIDTRFSVVRFLGRLRYPAR